MNYPNFANKYVLENFMRHPHARRMICAIMHIASPKVMPFEGAFHEYLAHPRRRIELRHLMKGAPSGRDSRDTLEEGDVSYENLDSEVCKTLAILSQNTSIINQRGLTVADLAYPLLKEQAVRALFALPKITRIAKVMLGANPNCPRELVVPPQESDMENIALAAARYGNLEDRQTVALIEQHLLDVTNTGTRGHGMGTLLRRTALPKQMAAVMDRYANDKEYAVLSQMDVHREYIREKYAGTDMEFAEAFTSDKQIKLPPDLRPENLRNLFYGKLLNKNNSSSLQARIALHPHADTSLVEEAINTPRIKKHMRAAAIGSESPHAEWVIEQCKPDTSIAFGAAIATLKNAAPPALLKAAKSASMMDVNGLAAIMTHPNFPWAEADQNALVSATPIAIVDVVLAARALYRCPPCADVKKAVTGAFPCTDLFSPNLTPRQLEKLTERHPSLRPLAACHPNGYDIVIEDEDVSKTVENFRGKFQLPSLSGKAPLSGTKAVSRVLEL